MIRAITPHADPLDLATQSLILYRELRDALRRILPEIGAAESGHILAMDERLGHLRQAIQQADAALMASPPAQTVADLDRLLAERRQVMAEVLSLHQEVIAQAESVKSLLAHDLAAMRAGREALRGYAPRERSGSGAIINRQS